MHIDRIGHVGMLKDTIPKDAMQQYIADVGDFTLAIYAARVFADRQGIEMVVIPGNSYMRKVYHISRLDKPYEPFRPGNPTHIGALVCPGVNTVEKVCLWD